MNLFHDKNGKYVKDVVYVHLNAFDGFFLSSLGKGFLKTYYKCFSNHKNGHLIVALDDDGSVLGFGAATTVCQGFNKSLILSNPMAFGARFMILLLSKPKALLRLINNFTKKSEDVVDDEDYGELYSIGVLKEYEGKGYGSRILEELEHKVTEAGCKRLSLTTDFYNNDNTIKFYKKNGYRELYTFTAYPNRKMYRLIKDL